MPLAFPLVFAALCAGAQPPTLVPAPQAPRDVPPGCECSADLRFVTVRVRRADGTPVTDAVVRTREVRSGRAVHAGQPPMLAASGEYVAVQDGDVRPRRGAPVALLVEVRWRGQRRTTRLAVETHDRCGCHVARVGDPVAVVFP